MLEEVQVGLDHTRDDNTQIRKENEELIRKITDKQNLIEQLRNDLLQRDLERERSRSP